MIRKIRLIETIQKLIKWDSKADIYLNGENNDYSEKCDNIRNNSVTAKMASNIMAQYLNGKGYLPEIENTVINQFDFKTVGDFRNDIAKSIVDERGLFIHVNYRLNDLAEWEPYNPKVYPFSSCRLGKRDSTGHYGKIEVRNDWQDKKEESKFFHTYNPSQAVITAQAKESGGPNKYKGQILYYNPDNRTEYPLSRIDSVLEDCISEERAAKYKNQLLTKGFFGRTLILVRPLVDDNLEEFDLIDGKRVLNQEYAQQDSEAKKFLDDLEGFIGAENAGGAMVIETDFAGDQKLEDAVAFKNVESNITPDLFENVERSVRENILITYNNLPIDLVRSTSGIFSSGASSLVEMKKSYWQNTYSERDKVNFFVSMFYNLVFKTEIQLETIPIIEDVISKKDHFSIVEKLLPTMNIPKSWITETFQVPIEDSPLQTKKQ